MNTQRRRRPLLWASGIVIAAWLLLGVAPGLVSSIREARWKLADKVSLLDRSRADLSARTGLEDSAGVLKEQLLTQAPRLVSGNSPAEAADALAGLVSIAVERGDARLTRSESIADSTTRGLLNQVRMLAAFDTDVRGMLAILRSLAQEVPILSVESLNVMVADPNAPAASAELLRVELVVRGWYLRKAEG